MLITTAVQQMGAIKLLGAFALPAFHLMAQIAQVVTPLYTGSPVALWAPAFSGVEHLPPPVPTPESSLQAIRLSRATAILTVPTFVVSWSHNEDAIETMRSLEYVVSYYLYKVLTSPTIMLIALSIFASQMTGGGPLPDEVGDHLASAGVNIVSVYGGTEFGVVTHLKRSSPQEWAWFEISPEVPVHLRPHQNGSQTLYELLVKVSTLSGTVYRCTVTEVLFLIQEVPYFRPAVLNSDIPEGRAYATSDLLLKHPTKELYKIVGRLDDQITMSEFHGL